MSRAEVRRSTSIACRLSDSRGIVFGWPRLSPMRSRGFVIQSLLAFWFHTRFGVSEAVLGGIFFGANILAAVSALSAARIAARIGLINTMVFTHLPSNVLLILVPLMPNLPLAILVLLARFSISQMDVPTRQSYTIAVVDPDERSAAAGVTGIARTTGSAISPLIATPSSGWPLAAVPFYIAGGLKIAYGLICTGYPLGPTPEEQAERKTPDPHGRAARCGGASRTLSRRATSRGPGPGGVPTGTGVIAEVAAAHDVVERAGLAGRDLVEQRRQEPWCLLVRLRGRLADEERGAGPERRRGARAADRTWTRLSSESRQTA
jgi:MFS family permease